MVACAGAEFKQENWKTRSMKLGKGVGNGVVSGAVAAKNMTVSGAKGFVDCSGC